MNDRPASIKRATVRPAHLDAPAYLSKSPPVPAPRAMADEEEEALQNGPTRYGDWEHKGMAIDF
jgi:hypothetical protein